MLLAVLANAAASTGLAIVQSLVVMAHEVAMSVSIMIITIF